MHNSPAHLEDLPKHFAFLKTMVESGVSRIAVMGSMHEIGFYEGSINENTACHPATLYGIAKNALREASEWLAAQNKATLQWLRGYYIVGDDAHGSSIFSKLLAAAQEGKKTFPFIFYFIHIFIQSFYLYIVRTCYLTSHSRYT